MIRPARPGDTGAVAELYRLQAELHAAIDPGIRLDSKFEWRQLASSLLTRPSSRILVADDPDGHPIGFVHARVVGGPGNGAPRRRLRSRLARLLTRSRVHRSVESQLRGTARQPVYGVIQDVFVDPAHRRHGTGRDLVRVAFRWFRDQGITRVDLDVESRNLPAVEFWRALGFRVVRHRLRLELDDTPHAHRSPETGSSQRL